MGWGGGGGGPAKSFWGIGRMIKPTFWSQLWSLSLQLGYDPYLTSSAICRLFGGWGALLFLAGNPVAYLGKAQLIVCAVVFPVLK